MFEIILLAIVLLGFGIGGRVFVHVAERERKRLVENGTLDGDKYKTGRI